MLRLLLLFGWMLVAALHTPQAIAQAWPSRALKLVVPIAPGASSDIYARFIATRMSALLGQPVVVENKPGGNGFIGVAAVTSAPADGYTVFIGGSSPMAQNPVLFKSLPYDPVKDFRWISGLFEGMYVVVVRHDSPYQNLQALLAAGKAAPKKLNYGSYAAAPRLVTEWLNQTAGMQTTFVNYKGSPQVASDLLSGILDYAVMDTGTVAPLVEAGQLRALAVTGDQRHQRLPQVPTLVENGVPPYGRGGWLGMSVRAETPNAIAEKLTATMMKVLADPATKAFTENQGAFLLPLNDRQMTEFHRAEIQKYRAIAQAAHIDPE